MTPIRIVSFVGVLLTTLFLPYWVFVPVAFVYALMCTPYELLIIAVCVDAQFGDMNGGVWYLYTLTIAVILIVTTSIKPYFQFYK